MMDWQPIETAPKDQSEIVGHDSATDTRHVTFWDGGSWHDPDNHYYGMAPEFQPTHWMRLPTAPAPSPNQNGG